MTWTKEDRRITLPAVVTHLDIRYGSANAAVHDGFWDAMRSAQDRRGFASDDEKRCRPGIRDKLESFLYRRMKKLVKR